MDLETLKQSIVLPANLHRRGMVSVGPCPFCGGPDRFVVKHNSGGEACAWLTARGLSAAARGGLTGLLYKFHIHIVMHYNHAQIYYKCLEALRGRRRKSLHIHGS